MRNSKSGEICKSPEPLPVFKRQARSIVLRMLRSSPEGYDTQAFIDDTASALQQAYVAGKANALPSQYFERDVVPAGRASR